MRTKAWLFSFALLGLGGCAVEPGALARVETDCSVLFRNYDNAVQIYGYSERSRGNDYRLLVPAAVSRAGQRLRQYGCLTSDADLAPTYLLADELRGALVGESGAAIKPISVHAGIVQGIASEVQARQFFGGLGVRVRSQGAPGLGRRIYLGPFATEGGLAEATELALRAGFVAPYPARF